MTITTYTDREIALQKRVAELERCLQNESAARKNVAEMRATLATENDTLRQQLAAATQLAQLSGEIAAELKSDKLALEAAIEASRKQEPVAFLEMKYEGGHEYLAETYEGATNSFPVFAAPVVAPDVPTEITEVAQVAIENVLREYNYPANPKNAARAGWRACRLHIAAMGGAA